MIDRERLRATMERAADEISAMADQTISAKLPSMVPAQWRPLIPLLGGRLQIRPTISAAVTRLVEELSDEEWRSLLKWVMVETIDVLSPQAFGGPLTLTERASQAMEGLTVAPPRRAIDHVRRILSE